MGEVETLNYKTVRYPGHRDVIKTLITDLRLSRRRDLLKELLEAAIPITYQDVVLIFVTASGTRNGLLMQETFARKVYASEVNGERLSAIQLTTAAGICTMADLMREGKLPQTRIRAPGRVRAARVPGEPLRLALPARQGSNGLAAAATTANFGGDRRDDLVEITDHCVVGLRHHVGFGIGVDRQDLLRRHRPTQCWIAPEIPQAM